MEVTTEIACLSGQRRDIAVDVANDAGVATRTLYQHFGGKEALFQEVIFARDSGAVQISRPNVRSDDTLLMALCRAAHYICEVALRPHSVDLMRLMISGSNRFPDPMNNVATATFVRFRRNVGRAVEALASSKLIPEGDHARSAYLFVDLVLGNPPIMTYANWETDLSSAADIEERVQLCILGRFGPRIARVADKKTARIRRRAGGGAYPQPGSRFIKRG